MKLKGRGDLHLAAELLDFNYNTLRREASRKDFPDFILIDNIRIYNIKEIAKYLGVPYRSV